MSSKTDEAFLVYGSKGTPRDLFRTTTTAGGVTMTSVHCGAGTYVYANGVVTSTLEEKTARLAPPGAGMDATTTATVMGSAKVELIDGKMRQTGDADGSTNVTVYTRATLPSGLEASCPK